MRREQWEIVSLESWYDCANEDGRDARLGECEMTAA